MSIFDEGNSLVTCGIVLEYTFVLVQMALETFVLVWEALESLAVD